MGGVHEGLVCQYLPIEVMGAGYLRLCRLLKKTLHFRDYCSYYSFLRIKTSGLTTYFVQLQYTLLGA